MTKTRVRKKKTDYQRAKANHWKAFSRYIRRRDCLKTTGSPDIGRCVTCNKLYNYADLQAGHYLPGRSNGILFDERGCHAQCRGCNLWGRGQQARYHKYMLKVYGQEVIDELHEKAQGYCKITIEEHREETIRLNRLAQELEGE